MRVNALRVLWESKPAAWLMLRSVPSDVIIAQLREVRGQIPLLYSLLTMNALAVAYTHYSFAPLFLTTLVPGGLSLLCIARVCVWLRRNAATVITSEYARTCLNRTTLHGTFLGAAYIAWSLSLDQYGGAFERGHVAVFIAVTVIGCIFCLMHLPQAALTLTIVVMVPYLTHYIGDGNPVFTAIAFNVALVTVVMIRVLLNSFSGFAVLVRSQDELAHKQLETERLSRENALVAHTDSLTGLPNRRYFFAKLDEVLYERSSSKEAFAVGVLDLDRFKPLNDTYGHAVGDRFLAEVGNRLRQAAGDGVIVARLGGDEFGLLILDDVVRATEIGQAFCDLLAKPFVLEGFQLSVGGSCGLAVYPDAGIRAHELFDRSDYALYHVKSHARGVSAMFSLAHETAIRSERSVEAALREADLECELDLYFQPIVDTRSMTVIAVEALARWTSPKLGRVPTDIFISTAERTGLIHAITLILFRKAVERCLCLPGHIGLSFNLSANDITCPATMNSLVEIIKGAPIDSGRITFEITETALLRDFDAAEEAIGRLRELKAKIALDDFGIGYSSLGYLRRLAPDKIKVDKSFASELTSGSDRSIGAAILGLCANLDLECVFEGIETGEQLRELNRLGYHYAQGYIFAQPMEMRALIAWLKHDGLRQMRAPRLRTGAGKAIQLLPKVPVRALSVD